jgi:hypothetical protein
MSIVTPSNGMIEVRILGADEAHLLDNVADGVFDEVVDAVAVEVGVGRIGGDQAADRDLLLLVVQVTPDCALQCVLDSALQLLRVE